MKHTLFFAFLLSMTLVVAQDAQWKFINGDKQAPQNPVYGNRGIAAPENTPGSRQGSFTWADNKNMWLYGGPGRIGSIDGRFGTTADLWRYEFATNQWAWEGGDTITDGRAVFGKKGVGDILNTPGIRTGSATWTDASGNLWLFGGEGIADQYGYLNDLWKYEPKTRQWTFISGDTAVYKYGRYGTKDQSEKNNIPGSRVSSLGWMDTTGHIFVFGGNGYSRTTFGALNDLWTLDTKTGEWSWIQGDSIANQLPVYGKKGIPAPTNKPTGRYNAALSSDRAGNVWMFGGAGGRTIAGYGSQNDLWMFNSYTRIWTWMGGDTVINHKGSYGRKNNYDTANRPGARYMATSCLDLAGNFYVFGGNGYDVSASGDLNDLWKFDVSEGMWTWLTGDSTRNQRGKFGLRGVASTSFTPASRTSATGKSDSLGNLYIFGGFSNAVPEYGVTNELWKYTQATGEWAWVNGNTNTVGQNTRRSEKFVAAPSNNPGSRANATAWTDYNGTRWLFGGTTYLVNELYPTNDLWMLKGDVWTWMSGGSSPNQPAFYGTLGVPGNEVQPGARSKAMGWTDINGNLWLYGGEGSYQDGVRSVLGDLWKFSPSQNQWTWMGSGDSITHKASYGQKGVPAATNHPGARNESVTWTDANGNFWLFGGYGYGTRFPNQLNDLWKYTPVNGLWTWMSGDSLIVSGIYGTRGVGAATNRPGSRVSATGAIDANGVLYLYGGNGSSAKYAYVDLSDLWQYTPSTGFWTYLAGDSLGTAGGLYGIKGVPSSTNFPGARTSAASFTDKAGNFFLFGGYGRSGSATGILNDLWRYQPSTKQWTWIGGDNLTSSEDQFGIQGTASSAFKPSARYSTAYPSGNIGTFWLFGGIIHTGISNESFQYTVGEVALPVNFIRLTAVSQPKSVVVRWTTGSEFKSNYFIVERSSSANTFDSIGVVGAVGFSNSLHDYNFNDPAPLTGNTFYRVKSVDKDGQLQYSQTVQIKSGISEERFMIIENPVSAVLRFSIPATLKGKLTAQVYDLNGKTLLTKEFYHNAGTKIYNLPVNILPAGTYFLNVQSDDYNLSRIFVKK